MKPHSTAGVRYFRRVKPSGDPSVPTMRSKLFMMGCEAKPRAERSCKPLLRKVLNRHVRSRCAEQVSSRKKSCIDRIFSLTNLRMSFRVMRGAAMQVTSRILIRAMKIAAAEVLDDNGPDKMAAAKVDWM
ncbi:hypothetical protein [Agrobacterium pusense]|uniref:hypothetical protein n=1 Tax=Agrobacterium pusense TaxID=648995 RepID=UPI003FD24DB4